jgi:hypothetical protein
MSSRVVRAWVVLVRRGYRSMVASMVSLGRPDGGRVGAFPYRLKVPAMPFASKKSGIGAYVLHADDVLAFMLGDGVPDGHVVSGQVQFVGTGSGSSRGKGSARVGTGSSNRWRIVPWTVHRSGCGSASISCQDEPGKRTRRSLAYSPRLSEFLTGERGSGLARAGISLDARLGHASPDFPPQSLQLSPQRIQFRTGDTNQLGCFGAHAAPSVRRFRPKCRSTGPDPGHPS